MICPVIGGTYLHCRGQVDNKAIMELGAMLSPSSLDGLAYSHGEVQVTLRKGFRAVLISELGSIFCTVLIGELPDEFGMLDSQSDGLLL